MTKERALEILRCYVNNDVCVADHQYVRDVLEDECGMTMEEIKEAGLDWLYPD